MSGFSSFGVFLQILISFSPEDTAVLKRIIGTSVQPVSLIKESDSSDSGFTERRRTADVSHCKGTYGQAYFAYVR